jgi:hypothetical protein
MYVCRCCCGGPCLLLPHPPALRAQAAWTVSHCPSCAQRCLWRGWDLALPLCLQQAAVLKAVAEQALHGKGLRTVVDTAVRDALQVGGAVYVGLAGNCYFAGNPFLSGWL